jgi:hypothetical protein
MFFCTLCLCFLLHSIYKIINSKRREIFLFLINYVTSTAKKRRNETYRRLNIFCSINKKDRNKQTTTKKHTILIFIIIRERDRRKKESHMTSILYKKMKRKK